MRNSVNAEIQPVPASGNVDRKVAAQREKLVNAFLEFIGHADNESILDLGMAPISPLKGAGELHADVEEAKLRSAITRYSISSSSTGPWRCASAEANRTGRNDSQKLPFQDGQFDWVFCDGVIEHAGNRENQQNLLLELARVAKKGIFVTAKNRRHPIEFNTGLPLLHWLPQGVWHKQLALFGKGEWASEWILNPLGSDTLQEMAGRVPNCASPDIGHLRIGGIKAHFFMMLRKEAASV